MIKILSKLMLPSMVGIVALFFGACTDMGDDITSPNTGPPQGGIVVWADVSPIFNAYCVNCHGGSGGLDLDRYDDVLEGGNSGPAVIPGDADNSLLVQVLEGTSTTISQMPPGGSLSNNNIHTIRRWIDDGALETAP